MTGEDPVAGGLKSEAIEVAENAVFEDVQDLGCNLRP
jgi:hypothetical protein